MQGLVTVFGGSGFLGAQAVRALAKRGLRLRVAVRNPGRGYRLRMLGDVGQIQVVQANIRNPASIARALDGAQACVNLVGVLYESGRQKFQSLHAMGARNLAEAAVAQGVQRFVQVSAIGAALESASKYARTKAMGEAAVREIMPGAVILRPSVVFGPEDHFFNRFAGMAGISPALPIVAGHSRLQPVYVGDVAYAVMKVLALKEAGSTFELGGPQVKTFRELMELLLAVIGRKRMILDLPLPLARFQAAILERLPGKLLTRDQIKMLQRDNVVAQGALGLSSLGMVATPMDLILPGYLTRYRPGGGRRDQNYKE